MTLLPTSIRAKLTLTAVAVMGILFVVLGFVVQIVGRAEIMAGVDADLSRMANETITLHSEMDRDRPPPPRDGDGGDHGDHQPFGEGPGHGFGEGGGMRGPFAPGRGGPGGPRDDFGRAVQRIGDPLLSIGPRFVAVTPGPPFAPPGMMVPYDKSVLKQAERTGTVYSNIMLGDEKVRIISRLAKDTHGTRYIVQYPRPLGDIDKSIQKLSQTLLLLLPVGLILTAVASLFLIRRVMKPIREITTTADSIEAEDLSRRLTIAGKDEFALLGGTIDGMLGRLQGSFEAQKKAFERLEAVLKQQRRFTADASHELKTPLAVIKANTGLMLHGMDLSEDERGSVEAIDAAAGRMNKLVQGLMTLARAESGQPSNSARPVDLSLVVQNAIDQVYRPSGKCVSYEGEESGLTVTGAEADLERVFVNLIDNACRHTSPTGQIFVSTVLDGQEAVVTVADDGEGIAPEHLFHLFDRFYRVDSARSSETGGTGLGLAICKSVVESHGGQISVTSRLGEGTTVTVRLPLAA